MDVDNEEEPEEIWEDDVEQIHQMELEALDIRHKEAGREMLEMHSQQVVDQQEQRDELQRTTPAEEWAATEIELASQMRELVQIQEGEMLQLDEDQGNEREKRCADYREEAMARAREQGDGSNEGGPMDL
jgi:hypothetical protein